MATTQEKAINCHNAILNPKSLKTADILSAVKHPFIHKHQEKAKKHTALNTAKMRCQELITYSYYSSNICKTYTIQQCKHSRYETGKITVVLTRIPFTLINCFKYHLNTADNHKHSNSEISNQYRQEIPSTKQSYRQKEQVQQPRSCQNTISSFRYNPLRKIR